MRSYRNSDIKKINSFDIKALDGFPVAKAKILYKNNQKVDGYKVFHETIKMVMIQSYLIIFMEVMKVVTLMIKNLKKNILK